MTNEEEFRAYMTAAQSTTSDNGQHLSEAEIIAFCRHAMSDAERAAAQAHLVNCEPCLALFRSGRDFVEGPGPGDEEISPAETEDAWRTLLQRLPKSTAVHDPETNVLRTDFSRSRAKKFSGSRLTLALAASLLISFGVLGFLGWRLWQEQQSRRQSQRAALELENRQRELETRLSQLEQSGADQLKRERDQRLAAEAERNQLQSLLASMQPERAIIPVYSFTLSSERGSGEDLSLRFKKGVQAVRLRLFQVKPYEFLRYAIELVDPRGQVVLKIPNRRPAADGGLTVQLKRATVDTGKYKLRLFGEQGTTRQPLGEYGMNITLEK